MSTEKTTAIIIRQADFSETSKVITMLTRDWGKISVMAKGARRLKSAFESSIDLLAICEIVFIKKETGGLDLLTAAKLQSRFAPVGREMIRLYGGYYIAELLDKLTEEYDPHPLLFDGAEITLSRLVDEEKPLRALLIFELLILQEIGQLPNLDFCMVCDAPIAENGPFGFWVNQGGLVCLSCQKAEFNNQTISLASIKIIHRLSQIECDMTDQLQIDIEQFREIRYFTTTTISHILGYRPKTLRYLNY